jgi:hypothetical protein
MLVLKDADIKAQKTSHTRHTLALIAILALVAGVAGCFFPGGGGVIPDTTSRLQDARIGLTIAGSRTTGEAIVLAVLVDDQGLPVDLEGEQAIEVNDQALTKSADGRYGATIPVAESYVLRVREPTRGVEETTLVTPALFEITSPLADAIVSLGGFTITWDQINAAFDTTIRVSQTVLGTDRMQTFGPAPDSGTQTVENSDLPNWQHGTGITMTISVTKQARQTNVAGFDNADVSVELTTTVVVTPGP